MCMNITKELSSSELFFTKHITFTSAHSIQMICVPFFKKTKTTYFNYVKRFNNGERICLSNRADWMRYFYEQELFENISIEKKTINSEDFHVGNVMIILWAGMGESKVVSASSTFDIGNGISLAFIHENCIEYCYFAAGLKDVEMSNWYINNIGTLIDFLHYFKEKAKYIIDEAGLAKNLIKTGKNEGLVSIAKKQVVIASSSEVFKPKHYFIERNDGEVLITAREMDCIKCVARGYTAKQVSDLLNITERTVEKHLENAKNKLTCNSKAELVGIILESGLKNLIAAE